MTTQAHDAPPEEVAPDPAAANLLMAAERTLLSWIRTSFAMISFGFALSKFLEYLHAGKPGGGKLPLVPYSLGSLLVALGAILMVIADREYLATRRELLPMLPPHAKRFRLAPVVGGIMAAIGVAFFITLLLTYGDASEG